jgi:hypothetical protein
MMRVVKTIEGVYINLEGFRSLTLKTADSVKKPREARTVANIQANPPWMGRHTRRFSIEEILRGESLEEFDNKAIKVYEEARINYENNNTLVTSYELEFPSGNKYTLGYNPFEDEEL